MRRLVLASLLLLPAAAFAQFPGVTIMSSSELAQHRADLLKKAATDPHGVGSETLHKDSEHSLVLTARVRTGESEVHALWADEFVVHEGDMVLMVGGEMQGTHPMGPEGEFHGSSLTGGKEYPLRAGDIAYIPAGVPHWTKLMGKKPAFYSVYKIKK